MPLPLKDADSFTRDQILAVQTKSSALVDFTQGSILLALIESNTTACGLFLQSLIEYVYAKTRLTTSTGVDVDTFVNPFGFFRKAAVPASGLERFSRSSSTIQALIPVGTQVSSPTSNQNYKVTLDLTNPHWSPSLNAYVILIGDNSIDIPIEAINAGVIGNTSANLITVLNSGIIGVDTVTNPSALLSGEPQETDAQVFVRFPIYLAGLSKGSKAALASALLSIANLERYNLVENKTFPDDLTQLGYFYAIVDDGTGDPPTELITAAETAMNVTRGFTIAYSVYPPAILEVDIELTLTITPTGQQVDITQNVTNSITQFLFQAGIGGLLPYSMVANLAYESLPTNNQSVPNTTFARDLNILNVTLVTVNGGTADLQATTNEVLKLDSITINYI